MAVELQFDSAPTPWRAYSRILTGGRRGLKSSSEIPQLRARWSGLRLDRAQLARYRENTLVVNEPDLPIHFPHVLASPLHLTMLSEPEFPLKLLGAVHLRNHSIRYRPVRLEERLDMEACLVGGRCRPQGVELDLDTWLESAGELVWSERTTFLIRSRTSEHDEPSPLADIFPWSEGAEPVVSFRVPPRAGKRFAALTGDYNPIHVSWPLARAFGFKRDLVHGMWGVARAGQGLPELNTDQPVRIDLSFKGPLYMLHQVEGFAVPCEGGRSVRLFCEGESRPAVEMAIRKVPLEQRPEDIPN